MKFNEGDRVTLITVHFVKTQIQVIFCQVKTNIHFTHPHQAKCHALYSFKLLSPEFSLILAITVTQTIFVDTFTLETNRDHIHRDLAALCS